MNPIPLWQARACLALSMALVGSYVALSKPLVAVVPVFLLAWLRFAIGALSMLGWLRRPADEPLLAPRTRRLLFLESFLGNFLFSICMLLGVSLTTVTAAGVVMSSLPVVVAWLSRLFLHEVLSRRMLAAMALSATGIALFSMGKPAAAPMAPAPQLWWGLPAALVGNLLVFAAVVCEAAYVVIGKHLTQGLGPKRISAIINLWGLALMTPLGVWAAWHFDFTGVAAPLWGLLLFYGLAASVWTVWLWMTGLRSVDASQAGIFTVMLPLSAAAIGVVFMGERLGPGQLVAFAVALAGLVLATRPARATAARQDRRQAP